VKLVVEPGSLLDLGAQPRGETPQCEKLDGCSRRRCGPFDDGVTSHRMAFGRVGFSFWRVGSMIVFVAFRFADTDRQSRLLDRADEVFEVRGILPGGIDADMDLSFRVTPLKLLDRPLKLPIPIARLAKLQRLERDKAAGTNITLGQHWLIAKDWSESSRYRMSTQLQAEKLLHALTDNTDGVLPWVKNFW
jgi:hypothetical protein